MTIKKQLLVLAISGIPVLLQWLANPLPSIAGGNTNTVVIKTVDENHNAFRADSVHWWRVADETATRHHLKCEDDSCTAWLFDEKATDAITIRAHASRVKPNDDQCWDLYEGELTIQANSRTDQEVLIVMAFRNTACAGSGKSVNP